MARQKEFTFSTATALLKTAGDVDSDDLTSLQTQLASIQGHYLQENAANKRAQKRVGKLLTNLNKRQEHHFSREAGGAASKKKGSGKSNGAKNQPSDGDDSSNEEYSSPAGQVKSESVVGGDNQEDEQSELSDRDEEDGKKKKHDNSKSPEEAAAAAEDSDEQLDMPIISTRRRESGSSTSSTSEHKKEFEKNPKSEFVESQQIPTSALDPFDDLQLPQSGEDYLKRKYGVSSYPTRDLKDLLPGPIPDADFTKSKPPNQVQFSTFAASVEPYFRRYNEEDVSFLAQKTVPVDGNYANSQLSPFVIPPIGPFYADVWEREDVHKNYTLSPAPVNQMPTANEIIALGSEESLNDESLEVQGKVSCGPLSSRLLSAFLGTFKRSNTTQSGEAAIESAANGHALNGSANGTLSRSASVVGTGDGGAPPLSGIFSRENTVDVADAQDEMDVDGETTASAIEQKGWKISTVSADFATLEERLKREFKYVGILEVDEKDVDWINDREDDEICQEMRELQKELKRVTKFNQAYKSKLLPIVQTQMAYQEYSQILEDLDKQVDQAYLKRIKNVKSKKKKPAAAPAVETIAAAEAKAGMRALLDKRSRWIKNLSPLFLPAEEMKRNPSESIFEGIEEEVKADDEEDGL